MGVVGCGGSRQTYGRALASTDQAILTALLDVDIVPARLWSKKVRGSRAYSDLDDFLADAPVDAVIVATPPDVREQHIAALLSAGKHVLAEAPVATQAAASLNLAQYARRLGTVLWPSMLLRFDDAVCHAYRLLSNGAIGQVRELRCEWAYSEAWAERKSVLQTWSGALLRHAVRSLDLARWWLGEAHAVSADIDSAVPGVGRGVRADAIVQHEAGVSVHHIHRTSRPARFERYIATGSSGVIELISPAAGAIDGAGAFTLTVRTIDASVGNPAEATLDGSTDRRTAYDSLLAGFIAAVVQARTDPIWPTAADAAAAQAILEAALVSSSERLKVTVPPVVAATIGPAPSHIHSP